MAKKAEKTTETVEQPPVPEAAGLNLSDIRACVSIIDIVTKRNRVLIQGISMVKRHTKPSAASKGGIEDKESSVHISNVSIVDPKDGKPSKIGFKFLDKGKKVRFSKRSGEVID